MRWLLALLLLAGCPAPPGGFADPADDDDATDDDPDDDDVGADDDEAGDDDDSADDDDSGDDDDSAPLPWPDAAGLGLGVAPSGPTTPGEQYGMLESVWLRVGGDPAQAELRLVAGLYEAGADGEHAGGGVDDVLRKPLPPGLSAELVSWTPVDGVDAAPPENPSGHFAEGSPPTFEGGVLRAGADSGEGILELTHPMVPTRGQVRLQVLPPDWCPLGDHRGGPFHDGFCE